MAESKYTQSICEEFQRNFPQGWIDALNFEDRSGQTQKMKDGLKLMLDYQMLLFSNLASLVLSGDHLINETKNLDELLELVLNGEIVPEARKTSKNKLQTKYLDFLHDVHDSIYLVKYHDSLTRKHFVAQGMNEFIHAIPLKRRKDSDSEFVTFLDAICDSCWKEYIFSYNENYISSVLLLKEQLTGMKKGKAEKITQYLDAAIDKLSFLLSKLSLFSKNQIITYNYDFKENQISIKDATLLNKDDLLSYFLCFMDVEQITPEQILKWQQDSQKKDVSMWNLVFLMRYYVKKTKTASQINNLITVFDKHYNENEKDNEHIINRYAGRSARNYMYNSRFSFNCQQANDYSFKQLKKDLEEIRSIQSATFIQNYHPYQKAIDFTKKLLADGIEKNESSNKLKEYVVFLKECFIYFKENVDWCKKNQPYLMQLRYNFSTRKYKDTDIEVFYPSSFCRPLRFSHLDDDILQYSHDIASLEYQVKHQDEKLELLAAKKQIANFERKNLETMSLVITVTTLLVGLLSIFIGNNGSVSIFSKMEYVSVLGIVLMLFVCLGYFVVSDVLKKYKPYIFGILSVIFIIYLFFFACQSNKEVTNTPINKATLVVDSTKQDSTAVVNSATITSKQSPNP